MQMSNFKLRKPNWKLVFIGYLILEIGLLVLFSRKTLAQSLSVSIDPSIIQIEAEAPADISAQISIQNLSDQTTSYNIFLMPFKGSPLKNGQIEFDQSLISKYSDFFERIRIAQGENTVETVRLAPNERKNLNLLISLLEGEPPRDYYFSVLFVSENPQEQLGSSNVTAQGGIGTNVLLSIGPKSETSGIIKEFSAPNFLTHGPVEFILNIANTSPHFVTIEGNVVVKNIFGHIVGNIDLLPVNILGNSERYMESENNEVAQPRVYWDEKFLLGAYTADLTVSLSENGPILKRSTTFFAIPLELIFGLGLAAGLTIGIIRRVKAKRDDGDLET